VPVFQVSWSVTVEAKDLRDAVWESLFLRSDIYESVYEVETETGETFYFDLCAYGRVRNPADRRATAEIEPVAPEAPLKNPSGKKKKSN
jgi:hypothetical protein